MLSGRSLLALCVALLLALALASAPAAGSELASAQVEADSLHAELADFQAQLDDMDASEEAEAEEAAPEEAEFVELEAEAETEEAAELEGEADSEGEAQSQVFTEGEAEADAYAESAAEADTQVDSGADQQAEQQVEVSGPAYASPPAPGPAPRDGADLYSYRACQKCVAHMLVFENKQYIGSFYGNQNPNGYNYGTDMAPAYTIPPAGTYRIIGKPQSQYEPGDSFLVGNPSVAGPSGVAGVTRPGVRNIRMHPWGGSTGCQTAPLVWSNKIWDLVDKYPSSVRLHIMYNVKDLPTVRNEKPSAKCHAYPVFGISC